MVAAGALLVPLAAPVLLGQAGATYSSALVVRRDSSFESFAATAMKFQQLSMKLATASVEPINKRFTEAFSKYGKPFATV